uniref:NADP-dependent oxidoreductase domain-containing protein n=1 Tax=Kalanchoe fedtschenkoi TaxID=63787 RepID=A0A7N0TU34_KALFE
MAMSNHDNIHYFKLNTGAIIPSIGLGTWQADPGLVGNAVAIAIKHGYRHIDCARVYKNEKEIGSVLKNLFSEGVGYSPLGSPGTSYLKGEVIKHPIISMVAEKLGKTPAQVALRWGLQMSHSVLPKSTNEARIKENFDIFTWSIPKELFAKFSEIGQGRLLRGTSFVHHIYGDYKTIEELWDGEI